MTYAPKQLGALGAYWKQQGGVFLGVVGDTRHTKGYHLGKDRIFDGAGPGIGWSDYSVRTARDKAGLTDGASAIDLGKLNGSFPQLRRFSVWLVAECRRNAPGTRDIREIVYTPDGVTVYGWSREAGYNSKPIKDYGDSSHLWHTHVSFYRDSEDRDKRPLFAPYFTQEDAMPKMSQYLPGYGAELKGTSNVRTEPDLGGTLIRTVPSTKTEKWTITGLASGGKDVDGSCTTTEWAMRWNNNQWEYTSRCNLTGAPTPPTTGEPDCTAAVAAAFAEGKTAGLKQGEILCDSKLAIAKAEGYTAGVNETKGKARAVHTVQVVFDE